MSHAGSLVVTGTGVTTGISSSVKSRFLIFTLMTFESFPLSFGSLLSFSPDGFGFAVGFSTTSTGSGAVSAAPGPHSSCAWIRPFAPIAASSGHWKWHRTRPPFISPAPRYVTPCASTLIFDTAGSAGFQYSGEASVSKT